jgi:glycosyltransferase involved in cell wall biosynthesis
MPVIHFDLLSGSSLHVYDLARVLVARGHEVTVTAPDVGGDITVRARRHGVRVDPIDARLSPSFDLIHTHQHDVGMAVIARTPGVPVVSTLHSKAAADRPIRSARVRTYVCVRPEVREHAVACHRVPSAMTTVIFNGIDRTRFTPSPREPGEPTVLFVGTVAPRRRRVLEDLVARTAHDGHRLRVVGIGPDEWLVSAPDHVSWDRHEVWSVEDTIRAADVVAAVSLSRTVIEAWSCGRPAIVYELEDPPAIGIVSVHRHEPPPAALMALFDVEHMVDQLERVYEAAA